jgi:hypothetical protein
MPQQSWAADTGGIDINIEGYDGGSPITLSVYDLNFTIIKEVNFSSSHISLSNLTIGETYYLYLDYKGIQYQSQILLLSSEKNITMKIYEPTSSDEDLVVNLHHIIIINEEGELMVSETLEYKNTGNKMINGSQISVSMPKEYGSFTSGHACCVVRTPYGLILNQPEPLTPNQTFILDLQYTLNPASISYIYAKDIHYNTSYTLIITDPEFFKTDSLSGFEIEKDVELGENKYDVFTRLNMIKGSVFTLNMPQDTMSDILLWTGVGALIIVIGASAIYTLKQRGGSDKSPDPIKEKVAINEVLDRIEADYKEGKINEVNYLKTKATFLEKLEKVKEKGEDA